MQLKGQARGQLDVGLQECSSVSIFYCDTFWENVIVSNRLLSVSLNPMVLPSAKPFKCL